MNTQIKFTKNDSFAFYVTINKITELLDNVYFTVKLNPDDDAIIQKTLGAGITLVDDRLYKNQLSYKVQLDGFDTEYMEVGTHYFFDIKAVKGNAQETLLAGELILSETQTGYINPAQQGDVVAIAEVYNAQFITDAGQSVFVETEVDPIATGKIGDLTALETTAKGNIVEAVNEVKAANDTEVTARTAAVSAEATARENADTTLDGKIDAETTARENADTTLDGIITDIIDGTTPVAKATNADEAAHATSANNALKALEAGQTDFSNAEWQTGDSDTVLAAGTYEIVVTQSFGGSSTEYCDDSFIIEVSRTYPTHSPLFVFEAGGTIMQYRVTSTGLFQCRISAGTDFPLLGFGTWSGKSFKYRKIR